MQTVYFIDTSVLLNILAVPDFDQDRKTVIQEMKDKEKLGDNFILPIATINETGNHIAHIGDGRVRRNRAQKLSAMIDSVLHNESPWTYNKSEISDEELLKIANRFPDYAEQQEMGLGDLSILSEYTKYKKKNKKFLNVKLWSLDKHLNSLVDIDEI